MQNVQEILLPCNKVLQKALFIKSSIFDKFKCDNFWALFSKASGDYSNQHSLYLQNTVHTEKSCKFNWLFDSLSWLSKEVLAESNNDNLVPLGLLDFFNPSVRVYYTSVIPRGIIVYLQAQT